jgi:hypothetical protein
MSTSVHTVEHSPDIDGLGPIGVGAAAHLAVLAADPPHPLEQIPDSAGLGHDQSVPDQTYGLVW